MPPGVETGLRAGDAVLLRGGSRGGREGGGPLGFVEEGKGGGGAGLRAPIRFGGGPKEEGSRSEDSGAAVCSLED